MDEREQRIRAKAYELWEAAGRPEGQESAHWTEATRLIDAEDDEPKQGQGTELDPGRDGSAAPAQVETIEAEVPVKRKKKASARPVRKQS